MNKEEWERLTNCEKLRCRICDLDVSESTSNKLAFELANIEDEIYEQRDEIDRLNNIRVKALEFIYKELIPKNVKWDYDDCIFSDLPVERIKPLVDILELKENNNGSI